MITIAAIGKKHDTNLIAAITAYQCRLRAPWSVQWRFLPHSHLEGDNARQEESQRLIKLIDSYKEQPFVVLLDEIGNNVSSPELCTKLLQPLTSGRPVVIIIGGAYGVTKQLQQRATFVWSLSRLVFPHQLVRLLLVEQLYRCQEIARGSQYHHM